MKKWILTALLASLSLYLNAETEIKSQNFLNGVALLEEKKYEDAVVAFTLALKDSPANPLFWERTGYAFSCAEQYYLAIHHYTMAIHLCPQNPLYYVERALAYAKTANQNAMVNDLIIAARMGETNAQEFLDKHQVSWKT